MNENRDGFERLVEGEEGEKAEKQYAGETAKKRKERSLFVIGKRMNVFICLLLCPG